MYLVTGGGAVDHPGGSTIYIDTTQALTAGDLAWVSTAPLPSARYGLRGTSINNMVLISGEYEYDKKTVKR